MSLIKKNYIYFIKNPLKITHYSMVNNFIVKIFHTILVKIPITILLVSSSF